MYQDSAVCYLDAGNQSLFVFTSIFGIYDDYLFVVQMAEKSSMHWYPGHPKTWNSSWNTCPIYKWQAKCKCILKFIYSEKATKFWEIFTLLLSQVVPVKSKVKISQNFVVFLEYINFNTEFIRKQGFEIAIKPNKIIYFG